MQEKFTDIFINRPVLATVISLLIFFVGLRAIMDLQVRKYPKLTNTVIKVKTSYPGAPANLVQGFITSRLEKVVASAEGIDYMTSQSSEGSSTIDCYIRLGFNPNVAFTNVMSKVSEVKGELPREAEEPVVQKQTGSDIALMYIGFYSKDMSPGQITDYITRVVQPKLEGVYGVSEAKLLGSSTFAMRIWLNPVRMAALKVTPAQVRQALLSNNFQAAAGKTEGEWVVMSIDANTDVQTAQQFENLVIKHGNNGALVHLRDVARVDLGQENYQNSVIFNGKRAVFIGIYATPASNPLTVIKDVRKVLPNLKEQYPPMLDSKVVYDSTEFIQSSINEVIKTIFEAGIIVILVIFLFLGSLRTVLIPIVTIPLSLIGVCSIMLALGYSLNLLTLLAMVLAIGMVVDDAIVVVENCYRHIETGENPINAALRGAREIAMPVISMTITLAAVYAPIGFMGGLTGGLFKEFAFTLAATVVISGIIALTLSPMMCSRLLSTSIAEHKFVQFVDRTFEKVKNGYSSVLKGNLDTPWIIVAFAFVILASCAFLYMSTKKELAPAEDQAFVLVTANGPEQASIDYVEKFTHSFNKIFSQVKSTEDYFIINGANAVSNVMAGIILKPWSKRKQTQEQAKMQLQQNLGHVAGLQAMAITIPSLPTGGIGVPIQFMLTSTTSFKLLYLQMRKLLGKAQKSGLFIYIDSPLRFNKPEIDIKIDRNKAAQLGVNMQNIADVLATSLGGNYANWFNLEGRSYKVIPMLERRFRLNPFQIPQIYVQSEKGAMIPLATLATLTYQTMPNNLSHFQQLNSAEIDGVMMPGHTIGEGLAYLQKEAKELLPRDITYNYAGQSRQYMQEGQALMLTFMFSIIVIFLVLAAQFESFRDPLVIMLSVPMAICGALLPLNWGLATINIYTQIGLITLIGLISKHGILMVEFANQLRYQEGLSAKAAIHKAATIRLRAVLMTTASMVLGVLPLVLATGAGAASRFDIGLVISSGMLIGTLFTLFVVPVMYLLKPRTILLFLAGVFAIVSVIYWLIF